MAGYTTSAFFVGFSLEILQSSQVAYPDGELAPVTPHQFPLCYPKERIAFLSENDDGDLEEGREPTHGNVLVYLPQFWNKTERSKFFELFGDIGKCSWPDQKVSR